jgi:hypothetical protein
MSHENTRIIYSASVVTPISYRNTCSMFELGRKRHHSPKVLGPHCHLVDFVGCRLPGERGKNKDDKWGLYDSAQPGWSKEATR